jgi:hypothetical protein
LTENRRANIVITTKWPRLLVKGQPVTRAQANEILLRTDDWWFSCNDQSWLNSLEETCAGLGRPRKPGDIPPGEEQVAALSAYYKADDEWRARLGILPLGYLDNSRIASSWAGGPYGWCDWDGTIGCGDYNIGKWPSDDTVTEDWRNIAAAFPYLDLVAQLVEDEGEGGLAGQWRVKDGAVVHNPSPDRRIMDPVDPVFLAFMRPGGERGTTLPRFREALAQVLGAGP